jgi:histidinol-phosphate aminotransferase
MIKAHIRAMSAYKPPLEKRSSKFLLCDFNERIDPVSPVINQAIRAYLDQDSLQRYPSYGDMTARIARYAEVPAEQVMLTNGSDHGIELIFRATCSAGDEVVVPQPSFAMYRQVAAAEGLVLKTPLYDAEGRFPLDATLASLTARTRLVVVGNPNNPTGTGIEPSALLQIAEAAGEAAVLVDECYFEYTRATVKDALERHPNLFITRTFSKTWGLAALRLGYILSAARNIEDLLKVRGPYDINTIAVVAARAALDNPEYMQSYVDEVMSLSKPRFERFLQDAGIRYWPGKANFVLTFPESPERVLQGLEAEAILVRPQRGPGIDGALRMSLGRLSDTERLIAALEKLSSSTRPDEPDGRR